MEQLTAERANLCRPTVGWGYWGPRWIDGHPILVSVSEALDD